ncbi:histidinol-phosphate transaminase [Buchnera aphidicola (Formosaphis micheliae)]|uniref:histidinol-phosphate transaminase n=1 Tax=Buchnera aphidicola TaxID=9 RepID=UPI0031CC89FA
MNLNIYNLVRKNIQQLIPYQSARRIGGKGSIWLNANESTESNSFLLKESYFNRYPEVQPQSLILRYANYINLSPGNILVTRGADEGIELLMRAFCEPGQDSIIYCSPTYDMYKINANILGIECRNIKMLNNWQLDVEKICDQSFGVKLIYICSPNNPTGNIIRSVDIEQIIQVFSDTGIVVIDEAYIEFCEKYSVLHWIKKYSNLVILRTLSKAFALAALRCGFVIANEVIIDVLSKIIAPYPIPKPVSDIAYEALSQDSIKAMKKRVQDLIYNRTWVIKELNKNTYVEKIFTTESNYILVRFINAEKIFNWLSKHGVIVRNQNKKMFLKQCIRITVGTFIECSTLINILNLFNKYHERRNTC